VGQSARDKHVGQRDDPLSYLYALNRIASLTGSTKTWYATDALGSVRRTVADNGHCHSGFQTSLHLGQSHEGLVGQCTPTYILSAAGPGLSCPTIVK